MNHKDKKKIIASIRAAVEKGTGKPLNVLKDEYAEDKLFLLGLRYCTTTKKAFCSALSIPVEAGCRYKRKLEKEKQLWQSKAKVVCPFTKHPAHLITTNPMELKKLDNQSQTELSL